MYTHFNATQQIPWHFTNTSHALQNTHTLLTADKCLWSCCEVCVSKHVKCGWSESEVLRLTVKFLAAASSTVTSSQWFYLHFTHTLLPLNTHFTATHCTATSYPLHSKISQTSQQLHSHFTSTQVHTNFTNTSHILLQLHRYFTHISHSLVCNYTHKLYKLQNNFTATSLTPLMQAKIEFTHTHHRHHYNFTATSCHTSPTLCCNSYKL